MKKIQAIKGMPDVLPMHTPLWQYLLEVWQKLMWSYGYSEIRLPLLEATALFKRSIGEVTDIVEKEMFTFPDKDGDSLTLRPEGTAGTVRAGIEHGLLYHNLQKLWYTGPMFRYEKPQKGRYRQFHHLGVEAFGFVGPDIEVEHILILHRLWQELGISEQVTLEINSLGSADSRNSYRKVLVEYFTQHQAKLDQDSKRRLQSNPLRILDSKNPDLSEIIEKAPRAEDYLNGEDKAHFEAFQEYLRFLHIPFRVNARIVRGLDYYNRTVFEWMSPHLGAQNTLAAGGRYDNLVQELGGEATYAVGFAIGIERVILLLQEKMGDLSQAADIYLITQGTQGEYKAMELAENLRNQHKTWRIVVNLGQGSIKNQFKRADKSGASLALIIGEEECAHNRVSIKYLRQDKPQEQIPISDVENFLEKALKQE